MGGTAAAAGTAPSGPSSALDAYAAEPMGAGYDSGAPLGDDFLMDGMPHDGPRETVQALAPGLDVELGYDVPSLGHFSAYDGAPGGLFLSAPAVRSPYAGLANGGNYVGSSFTLTDGLRMRFGEALLAPPRAQNGMAAFSFDAPLWGSQFELDPRRVQTSLVGADWDFASWGGLDMIASQTSERNGFLGNFGSNALAANTSAVGVSAHVGFGGGWVTTFSYNEGISQLSLRPNALAATPTDTLQSRAYGFAVAKHGLFGDDDSLGLAVSRPLQVYGANASLMDGFENSGALLGGHNFAPFSNGETDLELGYVTTFMNGALALQANAGYQMNVPGLGTTNSLSVISRAKINF
jgi:hypothetical protein